MNLLTLGAVKPTIARVMGVCTTDSSLVDLVNEAQSRLLNRSTKPLGSMGRYRFCVTSGCITLPRQIRSIESFAICDIPGDVRPEWHEFLGNGTHLYDNDDMPGRTMLDHGRTSTFDDIEPGQSVTSIAVTAGGSGYTSAPTVTITNDSTDTTGAGATATAVLTGDAVTSVTITASGSGFTEAPTITFSGGGGTGAAATATIARNRKIRVLSSVPEAAGLQILLLGYDANGQWVRTNPSGTYIDGELVNITNSAVNSTTTWSSIVRVVKPVTAGVTRLYSWDSTASIITRTLGVYEPSEERPIYRKMFIPGLANMGGCSNAGACESKSITVLAKLQHVPVVVDNDFLVIGNLAALKLMVVAIMKEEQNRYDEASILEGKAMAELDGELASYLGDGMQLSVKADDHSTWGANVWNPI